MLKKWSQTPKNCKEKDWKTGEKTSIEMCEQEWSQCHDWKIRRKTCFILNQQPQPQNEFWINSRVVLKPGPNFKKKFPLTALFIYRFTRLLKEKHNYLFTPMLQLIFYKTVVVVSFNIFSYKLKGKGTGFSFSSPCRRLKSRNDGMMYVNQIKVSLFLSFNKTWMKQRRNSWVVTTKSCHESFVGENTKHIISKSMQSLFCERIDSWLSFLRRKRGTSSTTRQLIWFLSLSLMDYPFNHSIHFDLNNTWIAHLLSWKIWMVMTAIPLESLSRKLMAPKTKAPLD